MAHRLTHLKPNKLVYEKSPYLLQHAYNPVDWYPWNEFAFQKARQENKPIFLSIGYSTCHWCHVMAQESFEDEEVARMMNESFISIKVDREERPEIDHIYMTICQLMTGGGGWPLNIIMTPEGKPFYAGTYFPRRSAFGRIGMLEMIPRIRELWESERKKVVSSAESITKAINETIGKSYPGESLKEEDLKKTYEQLSSSFDEEYGGFGDSPKFPTPHNLTFLLRYWKRFGNERALYMVEKTLQGMKQGGIYDHVGFGFHRYATDKKWRIPHFEKMLYDQALVSIAYIEAFEATGRLEYRETAEEIFEYVLREFRDPSGGFYSAQDADSEGEEGRYYLWTLSEIDDILESPEREIFIEAFNLDEDGNYSEETTGKKSGQNILYMTRSLTQLALERNMQESELRESLESSRKMLMSARRERVKPQIDDKILTDWNCIMVAAFAKAAQAFGEMKYVTIAEEALDFLLLNLRTPEDGRLYHCYREGNLTVEANLDDYAYLVYALIEMYEATFNVDYLETALDINGQMLGKFWDIKNGGLFFTTEEEKHLIARTKEFYDGAVPSGNSIAMMNLLRLSKLTGRIDLYDKALEISESFSGGVKDALPASTQFMQAVDLLTGPSYEVVIVGDSESEDTIRMINLIRSNFIPEKVVILRNTEQKPPAIDKIAEFVHSLDKIDNRSTAYICKNFTCTMPTTDIDRMLDLLSPKVQVAGVL